MVKNQFVEKQNERIETTGTVHTGIHVGGGQTGQGWPGGGRHGQDTGHPEVDTAELGALGQSGPAQGCWRQAGASRADGAGKVAR
jgi:hypothetical protein